LGIPPYDWWNECLHGVARSEYNVTIYPQAIALAAGWDVDALRQMADYTAEEGRAVYNLAQADSNYGWYTGLTFWTPNINIFRDPRWGRGQETYGEDPFLTAMLGKNFVEGLQGNDSFYLKAAACAKHFAVHSGPEKSRHIFDIQVTSYDLWDTYLPAFKELADAKVAGFMCAYNAYAGQPCCGSDQLMTDILRNEWKFTGYVTSDCGAIDDFYNNHKTHPNAAAAASDAVFHGTDVDCGHEAYLGLKQAVEEGLITEAQIDVSLKRLMSVRFRLGMFDPAEKVPFSKIDSTSLESQAHKDLALKMAQQSIVLLKNEKNTLPLDKQKIKKIAVIGPNADSESVLYANYFGHASEMTTLLEGIKAKVGDAVQVVYKEGVKLTDKTISASAINAIKASVKDADVIVFAGGISAELEGEEMDVHLDGFDGGDRTSIQLPAVQEKLLKELNATGKPVVLVLMTGSAIGLEWESQNLPAIVNAWYGGQAGGQAIADVLFGDYNPAGRLPVTFYRSVKDLPDFEDYNMNNRTYKYFKGQVVYPFGYGLSYTTFAYEWASQPKAAYTTTESIQCALTVKNTGTKDGDAVSQVYIKYPQDGRGLPIKELRTFERKQVLQGGAYQMSVSIPVEKLAKWDETVGKLVVPKGFYSIYAGSHSGDEAAVATFEIK
jgi:beta-glucosidase